MVRGVRLAWGSGLGVGAAAAFIGLAGACGSRTGLLGDAVQPAENPESGLDGSDARGDRDLDALPAIDGRPLPDVYRNDCPDAAITLIYVITTQYDLYSYNPPTGTFTRIGSIRCPSPSPTATPFSMAVDRKGVAYIVFDDTDGTGPGAGYLYRVSTATAACVRTPFKPRQNGITKFGMGFSSNTNGPDETLFIASANSQGQTTPPPTLAGIDVASFSMSLVGPFNPAIESSELTGTGDGRLFAFYSLGGPTTLVTAPTAIAQIDKQTARVIAQNRFDNVHLGNHWAFGFWGGDFYMFTGANNTGTTVTRFRPSDNSVTDVGQLDEDVVGAGVSTCAPER